MTIEQSLKTLPYCGPGYAQENKLIRKHVYVK